MDPRRTLPLNSPSLKLSNRTTLYAGHVKQTFVDAKSELLWAAIFSGAINLLLLAPPIFMLQVYDRVLPSQNIPTLMAFFSLVLVFYGIQAALEVVRTHIFSRIGQSLSSKLSSQIFYTDIQSKLLAASAQQGGSFKDLEQIRNFMVTGGPAAFFDILWVPVYIFSLFILHPYLGFLGAFGGIILIFLAVATHRATHPLQHSLASATSETNIVAEATRRNAETVESLAMTDGLFTIWRAANTRAMQAMLGASDAVARYGGLGRFIRLTLQSLVLAVGAWLVINEEATAGVMIAASLLQGRALSPIEQAITRWSGFVDARQAFTRLESFLSDETFSKKQIFTLPFPASYLNADNVAIIPPSCRTPNIRGIKFNLVAGEVLGIIGPSGSGKSSFVRALVGVWPIAAGTIRLDGSTIDQWTSNNRGKFIGYLPQRVELFSGTIGQNISRFECDTNDVDILRAASYAGVDLMIRTMPNGFNTQVGEAGEHLSAGQRQRIGLARALYKDPFLVVLDEPNSALDIEGEMELVQTINKIKNRGGIVVVVSHRPSALRVTDKLLALSNGLQRDFGSRDDVLHRLKESSQLQPEVM